MVSRPGHSLPELIVAVVFLGASLATVGTSTVLGARWSADAAERQRALRVGAAILDSVAATPEPRAGSARVDGLRAEWTLLEGGGTVVVVVLPDPAGRRPLAVLRGRSIPVVPMLPDSTPTAPGADPVGGS